MTRNPRVSTLEIKKKIRYMMNKSTFSISRMESRNFAELNVFFFLIKIVTILIVTILAKYYFSKILTILIVTNN